MTEQRRPGRYPAEMRDRAVRMVFEAERHTGSQWEAICSVADKLGPTPETVRKWVRRVEIDGPPFEMGQLASGDARADLTCDGNAHDLSPASASC